MNRVFAALKKLNARFTMDFTFNSLQQFRVIRNQLTQNAWQLLFSTFERGRLQQGMVSAHVWGKILHFVFTQFMWNIVVQPIRFRRIFICDVIKLATALECQKQLFISGISNSSGRESLEIAVINVVEKFKEYLRSLKSSTNSWIQTQPESPQTCCKLWTRSLLTSSSSSKCVKVVI